MTTDEMMDVIRAHDRGEEIEYLHVAFDGKWQRWIDSGKFNFRNFIYRIKPKEPREWWLTTSRDEQGPMEVWSAMPTIYDLTSSQRVIHVREVLPE